MVSGCGLIAIFRVNPSGMSYQTSAASSDCGDDTRALYTKAPKKKTLVSAHAIPLPNIWGYLKETPNMKENMFVTS